MIRRMLISGPVWASAGISGPRMVPGGGGLQFDGLPSHAYRVNLRSRTASRVLCRVGLPFRATSSSVTDCPLQCGIARVVSCRSGRWPSILFFLDAGAQIVCAYVGSAMGAIRAHETCRPRSVRFPTPSTRVVVGMWGWLSFPMIGSFFCSATSRASTLYHTTAIAQQ